MKDESVMAAPPSGTVTFLFTDIEGSTQLARLHPEAMPLAIARHHAILHEAISAHHGYVFLIIGDEFEVAFATALDGLAAALAAQRALRQEDWNAAGPIRVRMSLHTGPATPRGNDYEGHVTLSHTKRLMSTAYGGQILLSQATQALLQDQLPQGVTLRDLGEHRLKDFDHAEHIFQVAAPDLSSDFPPLKTLGAFPNNLPIQLTSFVGRGREMAELKRLLPTTRLLTLTGPGGTGKTRLSLQLAADAVENFPNGVWLVELAPLADPTLVTQTIAAVLGVREQPGRGIKDSLIDFLRAKEILLILDNCEHLIDSCAQVADILLHAAPQLKILASSREALGIAGETSYRVPSLALPDSRLTDLDTLAQNDCVRLFVERAMAADPSFRLKEKNASAIAQICLRLDGIPLAIELAAARTKVLSPEQIAARLDDRFRLLTGGSRTALERQQTLRALIDWSYDLLSEPERLLLRRLSVFAGGWTLETTQAVCVNGLGNEMLDLLAHLVDKSLVVVEEQEGEARYRLLETIRQYARDKSFESGESERVRNHHLDFFLRLAEEAEPKLRSGEQLTWLERVEIEHDNLRAALAWSLESDKHEAALQLAGAAYWFWFIRGYWSEGQRWLDEGLALDELALGERAAKVEKHIPTRAETARRAKALYCAGMLQFSALGLSEAVGSKIEESLRLWRTLEDKWWIALVLKDLGQINFTVGDLSTAQAQCKEGVALARQIEDKWVLAVCLTKLGLVTGPVDLAGARPILEEAVAVAREVGDRSVLSYALVNLASIYFFQGDYGVITPLAEEALVAARAIGSKIDVMFGLAAVGLGALVQGNLVQAIDKITQLLAFAREVGSSYAIAFALIGFGAVGVSNGQPRRAVQLFGAIESLWQSIGIDINTWGAGGAGTGAIYRKFLQAARAQLDEATFNAAMAEGRAMTMEQAIALANEIQNQATRP